MFKKHWTRENVGEYDYHMVDGLAGRVHKQSDGSWKAQITSGALPKRIKSFHTLKEAKRWVEARRW